MTLKCGNHSTLFDYNVLVVPSNTKFPKVLFWIWNMFIIVTSLKVISSIHVYKLIVIAKCGKSGAKHEQYITRFLGNISVTTLGIFLADHWRRWIYTEILTSIDYICIPVNVTNDKDSWSRQGFIMNGFYLFIDIRWIMLLKMFHKANLQHWANMKINDVSMDKVLWNRG